MHPELGTFHTEKWSEGLSTGTYVPNTLTIKYVGKNDTPRDPLLGPVTQNTANTLPNLRYVYPYGYAIGISANTKIYTSMPMLRQDPAH